MDSNLHAYYIYKINNFYYSFVTDSGAKYECSFSSYKEYFYQYPEISSHFFCLNLILLNPSELYPGTDKRIALSVIKIVCDFLNSTTNVVVYICDPSDGKGKVRSRKFKSWFDKYNHPSNQIIRINSEFKAGGVKLYTALLVHRNNKLKQKLVEAYLQLTDPDDNEK